MGIMSKRAVYAFGSSSVRTLTEARIERGDWLRESPSITRLVTLQIRQFDGSLETIDVPPLPPLPIAHSSANLEEETPHGNNL